MLEASRFPGRQRSSPLREVKGICGTHCCWCDAKIEIGMGPKMVHVTADTCVRCGEHGESRMVREPDAPPKASTVIDAKTGGAAPGPIVLSLIFSLDNILILCCAVSRHNSALHSAPGNRRIGSI
jgi:hypothetical protein